MKGLSIVIPALNAGPRLAKLVRALLSALPEAEIIIADGGSQDGSLEGIEKSGDARLVISVPGRGTQIAAGISASKGDRLLILHADSVLPDGLAAGLDRFLEKDPLAAGYFSLRFDAGRLNALPAWRPARLIEMGAAIRCRLFKLPYGDQGLFAPRALLESVGGYRDMPLMEDVDLARRLVKAHGRSVLRPIGLPLTTSAERYRRDGYLCRIWRNQRCLFLFLTGTDPREIAALYTGQRGEAPRPERAARVQ